MEKPICIYWFKITTRVSTFIQNINALTIAFLTLSAHNISQIVMWLDTKKVRFVSELLSKFKIAELLIFWVQTHFSSHWCSNIFSRGPSHSAEETNHMHIKLQTGRPCLFIWVLPEKSQSCHITRSMIETYFWYVLSSSLVSSVSQLHFLWLAMDPKIKNISNH